MTNQETALHLAKLAMPIDGDDWGTERQIDAENKLYAFVEENWPDMMDEAFEAWSLKASTDERIYELMTKISNLTA
jgi:hypothetical protein